MKLKLNYSSILFYILAIIFIAACSDDNNFEYTGEYPKATYINVYNIEGFGFFTAVDTNMVSYRNRAYVTIDSFSNIFLNGSLISSHNFKRYFKFVYTNPKKLAHLPESTEKAVIFFAVNNHSIPLVEKLKPSMPSSMAYKEIEVKANEINKKISSVIRDLQEEYASKEFGISLKEVTISQQAIILKKYPLNIAMGPVPLVKDPLKEIIKKNAANDEKRGLKERNVIKVLVKKDQVYLEGKLFPIENLTATIKIMIVNNLNNPTYPEKITRAIVSLRNERGSSYYSYMKVYDAVKKVYTELREEKSQSTFNTSFKALTSGQQRQIKKEIPMVLSEAEPSLEELIR